MEQQWKKELLQNNLQTTYFTGVPDLIIEDVQQNSTIKSSNAKGCLLDASAIKIKDEEEAKESLKVEYETLMETSEKAFLRTDLKIQSSTRTEKDSE